MTTNYQNISPQTYTTMENPPLLVDVRSQLEYLSGHAPNAVNISLFRLMLARIPGLKRWVLPKWFRERAKTLPIAVVCLTAHRSPIAAQLLTQQGYSQVYNLTEGMMGWKKSGLETCTGGSQI
ncbi:rhodanese-like domain-containing protein [Spirulina sp. CS-785/01]|uniref:rhodanese-like domain-containing protein n=1 Tax=Spirulina sp. CS-785/01 TaxID=3021716 RepID=UPI00232B1DD7|nr:rhodanese-like domain-containing protein [Spirulina sp. CS-785/01]MDB9312579.1 rhodanese-like domain-containing protein [Spirulina sp. CS-785/01]